MKIIKLNESYNNNVDPELMNAIEANGYFINDQGYLMDDDGFVTTDTKGHLPIFYWQIDAVVNKVHHILKDKEAIGRVIDSLIRGERVIIPEEESDNYLRRYCKTVSSQNLYEDVSTFWFAEKEGVSIEKLWDELQNMSPQAIDWENEVGLTDFIKSNPDFDVLRNELKRARRDTPGDLFSEYLIRYSPYKKDIIKYAMNYGRVSWIREFFEENYIPFFADRWNTNYNPTGDGSCGFLEYQLA